jgi:hypothetical protein
MSLISHLCFDCRYYEECVYDRLPDPGDALVRALDQRPPCYEPWDDAPCSPLWPSWLLRGE